MSRQLLRNTSALQRAVAPLQQCKTTPAAAVAAATRRWKSSQHNNNSSSSSSAATTTTATTVTGRATATAQLRRSQAEELNARGGISTLSFNVPTRLVFPFAFVVVVPN